MIRFLPYFIALTGFLVLMAFVTGMILEAERQRDRDARETIGIHEEINDADVSTGSPDDDRGWLRDWLGSD